MSVILHYLPTFNSLFALHLPYIGYNFGSGEDDGGMAEIKVMEKYQFSGKDGTGKTDRYFSCRYYTLCSELQKRKYLDF